MKNISKEVLITLVYYAIAYFILTYALNAYPSNGGPSEAVFLLFGFVLLSIIIFIYCLLRYTKGNTAKIGSIITHVIAFIVVLKLLM